MRGHRFKSGFGQCQCLWCGHNRHYSLECPVTEEIRARLRAFAAEHGRTWKASLRHLWNTGKDEGLLRQARNVIGPNRLDKISQRMLDA